MRRVALACLACLCALPAAAELVRVEAVGSVALGAASNGGAAARQEALESGIREAVERAAVELAQQAGSGADPASVRAALGDPKAYAASYRILEDRGERAPLLETSPGATREYVVAVAVEVDRGRLRTRLTDAGLLGGAGAAPTGGARRLVFEGVDTYPLWTRIRDALAARGGRVAVREFSPGRIHAELDVAEEPGLLVSRLAAGLGEAFAVEPRGPDGDSLRIAITRRPPPPPLAPADAPAR